MQTERNVLWDGKIMFNFFKRRKKNIDWTTVRYLLEIKRMENEIEKMMNNYWKQKILRN